MIIKADHRHIHLISQFQLDMAYESEKLELDKDTVKKGVSHIIDNPHKGYYLLSLEDETPTGCLLVLEEWSDWRNKTVLWIHSAYITPRDRGKGHFKKMYNYLKDEVHKGEEYAGIRLYVDKSNHSAKKVYSALGMNRDHYELYEYLEN